MEDIDIQPKLKNLYQTYNTVIKPLIADIEARYEEFPISIFNEIRAFNDHVARCYRIGIDANWSDIVWASRKHRFFWGGKAVLWIVSVILSALVSLYLSCELIETILSTFTSDITIIKP